MGRHFGNRLAEGAVTVWGVVTIVFIVARLLGDPAVLLLPPGARPEQVIELRETLGLNDPLWEQYLRFLADTLRGEFGNSYQFMRPALSLVLERLPASIALAAAGLALGVVLGVVAGSLAALRRGTLLGSAVMLLALLGQATPIFWLGIVMILVFSVQLGWLPSGGFESWWGLLLPTLALASYSAANIARLLRSSMLEVLQEDHVRTARAMGLTSPHVFVWHVLRNSLVPVVTMVAILAAELLGGAVITETVFSWPGIGRLIVQAIGSHDFPVVQAGVTVLAAIVIAINLGTDLLYRLLDPQIGRRR